MSREFLQTALERMPKQASVPITFIAEVDGRKASVEGHVTCNPDDDTLAFTLDVPAVRLAAQ